MSTGFDPLHEWLGIPPDEQPPHCYRLLGLHVFEDDFQKIANAAESRTAYLQMLLAGPRADLAQELLNQVATARAWLATPENKAQYDAWLKQQLGWIAAAPPVAVAAPPVAAVPEEVQEPEVHADLSEALGEADLYVGPSRSGRVDRKRRSLGVTISIGAAVLAICGLGVAVYMLQDRFSETGTLIVQWPEDERRGGVLEIDGKRVEMPPGPELEFRLPMGSHSVKCTRSGFEPYEVTMAVTTGKTTTLRPIWREPGGKSEGSEPAGAQDDSSLKKSEANSPDTEKGDEFSFDKKGN